ncbi:MAG TPA: transposase [Lacipirellulaceae bacterium]|nr:transposase [Lacipirellulaceae bacterium]
MAALATARRALPLYSHRHSPKKFTQHQLFACLVLKCFLKTDYRGVVAHLSDCPSLVEVLELASVPHYTTLQKAARRLLSAASARRLLDATVREQLGRKRRVRRSAIDSTGLEATAASGYFVRRRTRVGTPWKTVLYHRFPKLGVVCDVQTHFILAAQEGQGPRPDIADFQPLVAAALRRVGLDRLVADAGYDSEPNHVFARRSCGVRSIIPPKHGRPTTKPARGRYRRLMQTRFDEEAYRDRVQVETVISMVKRRLEPCVRGRTVWTQRYELRLKVLTHNVMILLRFQLFYRAGRTPFKIPNEFRRSLAHALFPTVDSQPNRSQAPVTVKTASLARVVRGARGAPWAE